jgi:hypothetical protein
MKCEICSSHSGVHEDSSFVEYEAVATGKIKEVWRNFLRRRIVC